MLKPLIRTALVVAVVALSAPSFLAAADTPTKKPPTNQPFFGVIVESVHPALANNLRDLLSPEQGLIVEELPDTRRSWPREGFEAGPPRIIPAGLGNETWPA